MYQINQRLQTKKSPDVNFLFQEQEITVNKPRPTFILNPKPMLVCNEVQGAICYEFTMKNQKTQKTLWEKKLSPSDMTLENGSLQYNYLEDKELPSLDRKTHYLLIGKASLPQGDSLQGQQKVILLEESTKQAVEDFEKMLELDNNQEVKQKWFTALSSILVFGAEPSNCPNPPCSWRDCMKISLEDKTKPAN